MTRTVCNPCKREQEISRAQSVEIPNEPITTKIGWRKCTDELRGKLGRRQSPEMSRRGCKKATTRIHRIRSSQIQKGGAQTVRDHKR